MGRSNRTKQQYEQAIKLISEGKNNCQIERQLSIPRSTIRGWRNGRIKKYKGEGRESDFYQSIKLDINNFLDTERKNKLYSYVLGVYLGDGYIDGYTAKNKKSPRYRLRIYMDSQYQSMNLDLQKALQQLFNRECSMCGKTKNGKLINMKIFNVNHSGLPCLFPCFGYKQGKKHERDIILEQWQKQIIKKYPKDFIKGLIQTDGCRYKINKNRQNVAYGFTNKSKHIINLFTDSLNLIDMKYKKYYSEKREVYTIAIYKNNQVQKLDQFIGAKDNPILYY